MARRGENIRKRKDGRWEGRYIRERTPDGKAKYGSVYAASYLETKAKLAAAKGSGEKKQTAAGRGMALREAMALWLEHHRQKVRQQTSDKYAAMMELHLNDSIGRCTVAKLEASAVNAFLEDKAKHGRINGKGGLSGGYIKIMRYLIVSSLEFVAKQVPCPALADEIMEYRGKKSDCRVLSPAEQDHLERSLCRDLNRVKLGMLLSLQLGLRIGEVCGLQWGDVNLQAKTLTISRTLQRIANPDKGAGAPKTILTLLEPKTENAFRVIPLPSNLLPLLKRFYLSRADAFVVAEDGRCIEPRSMRNQFQRVLRDCGLQQINFHALRHTFATRCVEHCTFRDKN